MNYLMKAIKSLVKIQTNENLGINTINARNLWEYLGIKTEFAKWIQRKIDKFEFIVGEDYTTIVKNVDRQKLVEYHVSIDMAKEMAMTENNQIGRDIRKYFIQVEKEYREISKNSSWINARTQGKLVRRELTDEIKRFVGYATKQGSKNADKYYVHISNLINRTVFEIESLRKAKDRNINIRDYSSGLQLANITVIESILMRKLIECIDFEMDYHDIYTELKTILKDYNQMVPTSKISLNNTTKIK